jgi:hypothetical protein
MERESSRKWNSGVSVSLGRNIAMSLPAFSGQNESFAVHRVMQFVAPLNAARTAQRAAPTKCHRASRTRTV